MLVPGWVSSRCAEGVLVVWERDWAAEWLSILTILAGVWYAQNFGNILSTDFYHPILTFWWPVGLVLVFGLACLFVIVYRVITFNDCEEASKELQEQIKEAQEDLKSKGLKF